MSLNVALILILMVCEEIKRKRKEIKLVARIPSTTRTPDRHGLSHHSSPSLSSSLSFIFLFPVVLKTQWLLELFYSLLLK